MIAVNHDQNKLDFVERQRDEFRISTDQQRLTFHSFTNSCPIALTGLQVAVAKSWNARSLILLTLASLKVEQIGFARAVTDYATFAGWRMFSSLMRIEVAGLLVACRSDYFTSTPAGFSTLGTGNT